MSRDLTCCSRNKPKFLTRSHFPFPCDDDIRGKTEAFEFFAVSHDRRQLQTREQFLNCKQSKYAYRKREFPLLFFLLFVAGLNLLLQFGGRFGFVFTSVLTYTVLSLRGHYECKRINAFTGTHSWAFGGRGHLLVKNFRLFNPHNHFDSTLGYPGEGPRPWSRKYGNLVMAAWNSRALTQERFLY